MMKKVTILLLLLLGMISSCQFFETKKFSSETFFDEEIKSIDWNEVDQYPTFSNCESFTEKTDQKVCFETAITSHLYRSISKQNFVASNHLNDTIILKFSVSKKGMLVITDIEIDSILQKDLPRLSQLIFQSIDSIQPVAPAYKRGIPVQTTFTLPIVLQTQ